MQSCLEVLGEILGEFVKEFVSRNFFNLLCLVTPWLGYGLGLGLCHMMGGGLGPPLVLGWKNLLYFIFNPDVVGAPPPAPYGD